MYVVVVSTEIKPEHRQDFIKAALQNAHDSCLNEPGIRRIELVEDERNPNRFYEVACSLHLPYTMKLFFDLTWNSST